VELYFEQLSNTENVNGCIYDIKVDLNFSDTNEYKKLKQKLKESVIRLEKTFV
jgi:hypothetical protein